jgi:hypothetical protein
MENQFELLNALADAITDAVTQYVGEAEMWDGMPVLLVNEQEREAAIDLPGSRPGWEEFSLEELVYDDEDGNMEPDSDAIWELANQFVDLRQR